MLHVYKYIFVVFSCDTHTHNVIAIWNIMIFIIDSLVLSMVSTDGFAWNLSDSFSWRIRIDFNSSFSYFAVPFFGHTLFGQMVFLSFYVPTEKEGNKSHSTTKHKKINLPSTNLASVVRLDICMCVCFMRMCKFFIPSSLSLSFSFPFHFMFASCVRCMMPNARCLVPYAYAWCYHYCLNEYWNRLLSYARVCESK